MKFESIYDLSELELFSKFISSYKVGQWNFADEEFDVPFIILSDDEDDLFIISIVDVDIEEFVLISPNVYYTLSTNKLREVIQIVSEYCN